MENELVRDADLLQEYLAECDELLQRLDQDLVMLESVPEDAELLHRAFRALHTIKGTSGFMGFTPVVELSHHAEDVLNLLRKGERKATPRTMDVLLDVLDQLRLMMSHIRQGTLQQYELGELLERLRQEQAAALPESAGARDLPGRGQILGLEQAISHAGLEETPAGVAQTNPPRQWGDVRMDKRLSGTPVREALTQDASADSRQARSIRVDVAKLDALINLVGELVLERNRLVQLSRDWADQLFSQEKFQASLIQSTARLSFLTEELQLSSLKTRMVSMDMVFRRFPRLVRDMARGLGKEVDLVVRGEETELDKTMIEQISDPLVHLVRNALDHGIEPPEVRAAGGKPPVATVGMEAQQEGDHIVVRVSDDGAGIDPERIRRKAVEKGLIPAERARALSRSEILDLIFLPGFSTAERLSDVSGRGVGMDVVRANLKKLNGIVELDSQVGQGTSVTLRLPLTLAILPALLVGLGGETYALPLRSVVEIVRLHSRDAHRVGGAEVFRLRDRALPLLRLRSLLHFEDVPEEADVLLPVVIVGIGERRFGLVVEELIGQEEIVVKPLGPHLRQVRGLAGATLGGDGRVRLILDPAGLLEELEGARA